MARVKRLSRGSAKLILLLTDDQCVDEPDPAPPVNLESPESSDDTVRAVGLAGADVFAESATEGALDVSL
ncbi:hypothetical protein RSPO_c00261 [Ralstonia solanacearum Po82]|uniref:Uncharacterized protein n=1 Tax=Ralstonia solanacearum (strain Po82) TaxID=1031711 RepID=F6G6M0_RALS8|nr:hypothetical protein RSPO_c00261 [Ralstonia solanacearum Po82]